MNQISVVVVDDHPVVRDGLLGMLSVESDISVVADVGTGQEALAAVRKYHPNVMLVDLVLPDMDGAVLIRTVVAESSDVQHLVLTSAVGDEEIYRALDAGARGYLFKDMARKDLIRAVRTVRSGHRYIPEQVGSKLAEHLSRSSLSSREVEILRLISVGQRNKEIAGQLGLSEATVNTHVKHILQKLNASDRTEAVTSALRRGIIRL
jgi:DNA-binding NarL/FixJ family response regulator